MWTSLLLLSSLFLDPDPAPSQGGDSQIEVDCADDLSSQSDLIARLCREARAEQVVGSPATGSGNLVILVPVAAATAAGIGLAGLKQDAPASR